MNRESRGLKKYPEKIIQFGEGNFLRCFVDWQIDILNEKTDFNSGIAIIRPIDSDYLPLLDVQDGLYTAIIRGINENGEIVRDYRVISSVNREIPLYKQFDEYLKLAHNPDMKIIVSNTTEAGISFSETDKYEDEPQSSFPGKLTRLLHERFKVFKGDEKKGFIIMPCELIDYNGEKLKELVFKYAEKWELEEGFKHWLNTANTWCSTLVDRIVTGYPRDEVAELQAELGYEDKFMTTGEYFYLFVIQGPKWLEKELKLDKINLNIKIVDDIKPYKTRKVGILNGAHTAMVPVSYLYGIDTVKETLEDDIVGKFVKEAIYDEIIPALDMNKKELVEFAEAVIKRFKNPYVKHQLIDISLNSMTKFKTRVLPQILNYNEKYGKLPKKLVFSFAALMRFYKGERAGDKINLRDDAYFLELYKELWGDYDGTEKGAAKIAEAVLALEHHWGENLLEVPGLKEMVSKYLYKIDVEGVKVAFEDLYDGEKEKIIDL
jgi:tagaturonate reductase